MYFASATQGIAVPIFHKEFGKDENIQRIIGRFAHERELYCRRTRHDKLCDRSNQVAPFEACKESRAKRWEAGED